MPPYFSPLALRPLPRRFKVRGPVASTDLCDGRISARPCQAITRLALLRETKILRGIGIVRAHAKRFVKLCNGFGNSAQLHINDAETIVHWRLRIEPRGFQIMRLCTLEVAFQVESAPKIIMRFGMLRFVPQRSLELRDRLIQLSTDEKEDAVVIMRATRLWT